MPAGLTLTLEESLLAPAQARSWTDQHLLSVPPDVRADILLMVSELVTNAVRHGGPDIVLSLAVTTVRIRIEVRDSSEKLPAVPEHAPSGDRTAGRGLLIVAATATDWGVQRHADGAGKTVWAEVVRSVDQT